MTIAPEADEARWITARSEATNTWLRTQVDPTISPNDAWQKLIDSVTTSYDSMEQLDHTSGYIRTLARIRESPKGPKAPYLVRHAVYPLTYKIKLRADQRLRSESEPSWRPYDRVFKEDAELVEMTDCPGPRAAP